MADFFINLGGRPVVELRMGMPRIGAWWGQLAIADDDAAPTGPQTLWLNGFGLRCFVRRSDVYAGAPMVHVVGGAGGLGAQLPAKAYRQQTLGLILSDILGAGGEKVSPLADAGVLSTIVPAWMTPARKAGQALASLMTYVDGAVWRVLPDGTVWVGKESWPTVTLEDFELLSADVIGRRASLFTPTPILLPGQTFHGSQIEYVSHHMTEGAFRTDITIIDPEDLDT